MPASTAIKYGAAIVSPFLAGAASPEFRTYSSIINCFNTATMYTLLAIGIAFVIMTGEIDVSIGATLGLTAALTGLIAQQGGSIAKMLLVCVAVGAVIGLVNGIGVSVFGVPSLIFTLGTNGVIRGLIYIVTDGRTVENFGGVVQSYGNKVLFAGITWYYAIAVVLVAIAHIVLTRTRKGKYFIAVGDNPGGANLVGISVRKVKLLAYVLCGLFAGAGGYVFASKYGQVMTVAGSGYEMTAIAACVLGGISLSGGLGNMLGAAIGAVIMSSISRLLVFIGLPPTYDNTITGIMLPTLGVVAVGKDMERTDRFFKLATRIVAEMGVQMVKTYYCENFEEVVAACPVPIVVAGGKKLPENEALTLAYNCIRGGAKGVDMGRNIFQSNHSIEMAQAIRKVVHEGFTDKEAYEFYRDAIHE